MNAMRLIVLVGALLMCACSTAQALAPEDVQTIRYRVAALGDAEVIQAFKLLESRGIFKVDPAEVNLPVKMGILKAIKSIGIPCTIIDVSVRILVLPEEIVQPFKELLEGKFVMVATHIGPGYYSITAKGLELIRAYERK